MNDREIRFEELISRQIDGSLSVDEHRELQDWINADLANAERFAEYALLHNGLHQEFSESDQNLQAQSNVTPATSVASWPQIQWILGSLAALLLIGLFLFPFVSGTNAIAAEEQLERLIAVSKNASDRSYLITAIESRKEGRRSRQTDIDLRKKKKQPPIDGAMLHIRGHNQYVLIRRFANGDQFITGCDGSRSWAVPPKGKVRVSERLNRFQGSLPGNQHDIPFINVQEDLERIREAYDIHWLDTETDSRSKSYGCLVAEKKSPEHRGAKDIEIWFDRETGIITEMLLDRLPQGRGGPRTVLVELTDQSELPNDFFHHTAHHDPERKVVSE